MSFMPYLPAVNECQWHYVDATTREHWLRRQLQKKRALSWKNTDASVAQDLAHDIEVLEWLRAEAEHHMVRWRSMLHAHGVSAI